MEKDLNYKNYFLRDFSKKSSDISYLRIYEDIQSSFEKSLRVNISISLKKAIKSEEAKSPTLKRYDLQDSDVLDSKNSNTRKLKEKYEGHIKKIQKIDVECLSKILIEDVINESNIENIFSVLTKELETIMFDSLRNNLVEAISQEPTIKINYESLLNYLYILPSKKIQKSDIAIDSNTGKIIIFYNSDEKDFYSKKISIISNAKDFTVSIISRKDGLAKFSGVYASKFPEAYYKIESIMETLT